LYTNSATTVNPLDDECEAQMLQAVRTIPSTCSLRIAELNQFGHNWITMSGFLLP